jgi:hypothetical protein
MIASGETGVLNNTHRRGVGPPVLLLTLLCALLWSCGGGGGSSTNNPAPPPPDPALNVTTTALPNGWVGHAYTATLSAKGGTAPLSWALKGGMLPAGLAISASGTISGSPTATAVSTPLTFTVTDSYATRHSKSVTVNLTVSPANITVAVTPAGAAVTVAQPLTVIAATNDYAGASWGSSAAGGTFSTTTSQNGAAVIFTAPATAGVYTITATSVTDPSKTSSMTVGVTDLEGIYTYHVDLARDGVNAREFALTTTNVNTKAFGKLFSCTVDGAVFAQPLWVANLTVGGARHNVVFVATGQDSLYAFDADRSPCLQLWHVSLIDAAHGGTAGEITTKDYGIVATPVIDPAANVLYVACRSVNSAGTAAYQRLHVVDVFTGSEKTGSPVTIQASFPYAGGQRIFNPLRVNAPRAGLALVKGTVYVAFGAWVETGTWFGWMMGYAYSGAALTQTAVFNVAPNGNGGGIWMSGGAPAADANGNLYVITGNGTFDANTSSLAQLDYGDSFLQLNGALGVKSYFAPSDEDSDYISDHDFGSGGATLVLNLNSGPLQHVVVGGGKDGALYLINGDNMGGFGDDKAVQRLPLNGGIFSSSVFWNNTLYIGPAGAKLQAYAFDTSKDQLGATATSASPSAFNWPGAGLAVSVAGNSGSALVWAVDSSSNCFVGSPCGPAVLHAYPAANLATELWNSSMVSTDAAGNAVKFTVPSVANGKVYLGTRGKDTVNPNGNSATTGELDVYGLKP